MTRTAALAAGALALALAGCTAPGAPPPAAPEAYRVTPGTVRPGETALVPVPRRDGETAFELIGLTTGMRTVLGSHAELPARGEFLRVRVLATNAGRTSVTLDTRRPLLLAGTATHPVDPNAMLVKRQPELIELGAGNRAELDLYFDVPVGTRPTGVRLFGGPTLADFADASGVDVPLPGWQGPAR